MLVVFKESVCYCLCCSDMRAGGLGRALLRAQLPSIRKCNMAAWQACLTLCTPEAVCWAKLTPI